MRRSVDDNLECGLVKRDSSRHDTHSEDQTECGQSAIKPTTCTHSY